MFTSTVEFCGFASDWRVVARLVFSNIDLSELSIVKVGYYSRHLAKNYYVWQHLNNSNNH